MAKIRERRAKRQVARTERRSVRVERAEQRAEKRAAERAAKQDAKATRPDAEMADAQTSTSRVMSADAQTSTARVMSADAQTSRGRVMSTDAETSTARVMSADAQTSRGRVMSTDAPTSTARAMSTAHAKPTDQARTTDQATDHARTSDQPSSAAHATGKRARGLLARRFARKELRRRRAPEEARVEILDAAERVFVEFQPDQVGLKDIAREAGVSHALITHYFGTYANMCEAVLERRVRALRGGIIERLKDTSSLSRPDELLAILFAALADPVHLRLTRWLLASERPGSAHAFALREQGLVLVAYHVAHALDPQPSRQLVERVELALMTAVAAAYGYAIGKYALVGALGREASVDLDRQVQKTLGEMLHAHLRVP